MGKYQRKTSALWFLYKPLKQCISEVWLYDNLVISLTQYCKTEVEHDWNMIPWEKETIWRVFRVTTPFSYFSLTKCGRGDMGNIS